MDAFPVSSIAEEGRHSRKKRYKRTQLEYEQNKERYEKYLVYKETYINKPIWNNYEYGKIKQENRHVTCTEKEIGRIRMMMEMKDKFWIQPFLSNKNTPTVEMKIDNTSTSVVIDTGATRVMATAPMAHRLWGRNYKQKLKDYKNTKVYDAQGNLVNVEGYKLSKIEIGKHLTVEYPVLVYTAQHEEFLVGFSFLRETGLNVYSKQGIGTETEVVRRLHTSQEKLICVTTQNEIIPPKSMRTVRGKILFPDTWSIKEKNDARGTPIVTHSEDLESLYVTQLTIPYTYDVIDIDHTVHVLVDNTDGIEPIKFQEGQVIAHREVLYEETPVKDS